MSIQKQLVDVFEIIKDQYPWAITEHNFAPKQDILVEDNDGSDVFLIREGKVAVLIGGGNSEVVLGKDDLIGEMSFLLGNKRTASIVAKEDVQCWSVNVHNMEKIFDTDAPLATKFYKSLGSLIANRLVNDSKRYTQNLVFQDNDDALLSLMNIQGLELRQSLENTARIVSNRLQQMMENAQQQIVDIHKKYEHTKSEPVRSKKQQEIQHVVDELTAEQDVLFREIRERLLSIFMQIQHLLMEILDLEKRNEVGRSIHDIFQESLFQYVPIVQKRQNIGPKQHQIEPLLLSAHLLQETHEFTEIWEPKLVIAHWIDRILKEFPTIKAYQKRHRLISEHIVQYLIEDTAHMQNLSQVDRYRLTLVNDAVGSILARIYAKVARVPTEIQAVSHDATSLYYMDSGMDVRSGKVKMLFHKLPSMAALLFSNIELLPSNIAKKSQRIIAVDGVMDYLPDRYLVMLIEKCLPFLADGGCILLSAILPTDDVAFITDFLQWPMVRRTEEELGKIFAIFSMKSQTYVQDNAIVVKLSL